MTTLDDELAVKTAPARLSRGRKHAPTNRRKGFKGWIRRWWWVFVVVPLVGVIGLSGLVATMLKEDEARLR